MDKDEVAKRMKEPDKKKAVIVIIRHGSTKLNSEDKIRGWLDLPLDKKGHIEAKRMGEELIDLDLHCLISSDMKRAKETAEIVSEESGIPFEAESSAFRPWDVGIHQGKLAEKVLPEMEEYARDKPSTPLPEGESFNRFKNRFLDGIIEVQKKYGGKKVGIVTHHRGDRVFAAWEKKGMLPNKSVDLTVMFEKGIEPGEWRVQGTKINTSKKAD